MIKEQINVEIFAINHDSLLTGDEREADPQLQDEPLHLPQDRRFQVLLAIRILEPQEIEEVRIAKDQVRRDCVLLPEPGQLLPDQLLGLPRQRRPLEEHPADLRPERPDVPALEPAHLRIEVPLECVLQLEDLDEMAPA